jgi:hypothetical protein
MPGAQHGAVTAQRDEQIELAGAHPLVKIAVGNWSGDGKRDAMPFKEAGNLDGFLSGLRQRWVKADCNALRLRLCNIHKNNYTSLIRQLFLLTFEDTFGYPQWKVVISSRKCSSCSVAISRLAWGLPSRQRTAACSDIPFLEKAIVKLLARGGCQSQNW